MIKTFGSKALRKAFEDGDYRKLNANQRDRILLILDAIDNAEVIENLFLLQTFKTHPLSGKRKGTWAMWVNKNWRITFEFRDGHAFDVQLEDYH